MGRLDFLVLALGELAVVLVGQYSLPVAAVFQVLVPVLAFRRNLFSGRGAVVLVFVFGVATVVFAALLETGDHTVLPLVALAFVGLMALLLAAMARYRIGQRFGGPA
jgi:hypothetical protein